jgi:hypothetical protein
LVKDGIFVCGSPYADVPTVAWALGQHDAFSAGPASGFLYAIFGRAAGLSEPFLYRVYKDAVSGGGWLSANGLAYPDFLRYLGSGVDQMFSEFARGRRWVDSSPENAMFIDELAYMFPRSTFVVVQEDPEYVLRVLLERDKRASVHALKEALEISSVYKASFAEVSTRRPDRVLIIDQRTLISDPARAFALLLDFVGEVPSLAPSAFFAEQTLHCGLRSTVLRQQRGPIKAPAELLELLGSG